MEASQNYKAKENEQTDVGLTHKIKIELFKSAINLSFVQISQTTESWFFFFVKMKSYFIQPSENYFETWLQDFKFQSLWNTCNNT